MKTCPIDLRNCYSTGCCMLLHMSTQNYDVYYCQNSIDHRMATGLAVHKITKERFKVTINLISQTIKKEEFL